MADSFNGSTACWVPDTPLTREDTWRLKIAQFGDGYAQRSLDGINALNRAWQVSFSMKPEDVINSMAAFLEKQKAKSFDFMEPQTGVIYRVWCDKWSISWDMKRSSNRLWYGTLSADFVRAYGITA